MFQDQMETMHNTLKEILARISALEQTPGSRNTSVGYGFRSGGDKVYSVSDYSTSTSSRANYDSDDRPDYRMKIDLPQFNGQLKIEEFLDWLAEVERLFDYTKIAEEKQAKLVAYKLKGSASAWWEQVQATRTRSGKEPVRRWDKMKKLIKTRFLPPDYEQILYQQYQNCKQLSRFISAYIEEFYRLQTRLDLNESEAYSISRYKNGLRWDIEEKLSVQSFHKLTDVVLAAEQVEQLMETGRNKLRAPPNVSNTLAENSRQTVISQTSNIHSQSVQPRQNGSYSTAKAYSQGQNPYAANTVVKCYCCNAEGHKSNVCPTRKMVNFVDTIQEEEDIPVEVTEEFDEHIIDGDCGETLSLIVQKLLYNQPIKEEHPQRRNVFRARGTINGKVCNIIIDGGSSENMIAASVVKKLGLKTKRHPRPYKVGWIHEGHEETKVTETSLVKFSLGGKYFDEEQCDVIDMTVCHLLLGRPWQSDCNTGHGGLDNTYTFYKQGKKFVLNPIGG